jgi:hypothetical protein
MEFVTDQKGWPISLVILLSERDLNASTFDSSGKLGWGDVECHETSVLKKNLI